MIVAEINNGLGSTVSAHFWWLQNNQQQFKIIVMIKIHGHKLIPNTSIQRTCLKKSAKKQSP